MAGARALKPNSWAKSHEQSTDWRIASLAARQHGVIARFQLLKMGLHRREVGYRLDVGRLHRIHRGVYAVGHAVLTADGRYMAAVLAGGPGAVASHQSAAAIHGIRQDNGATIHVTVERALHPRRGLTWHRSPIAPDEVTVVGGVPVTTVPRTLFDLATALGQRQAERAMHEADVRRLADALSLQDIVERYPHRQGISAARAVLAQRQIAVTESELEEAFHAFLATTSLPMPTFNEPLFIDGRWLRPDCTWQRERLIAELDGRSVHDTDRTYETDRERDRQLLVAGWRVVRITWRQLQNPARLKEDLTALLA
jgi:predicted transcriptional regulator of viral defense system